MERTLDLRLAYKRARDEINGQPRTHRALVTSPFELELAEVDLDAWLDDLAENLEADRYSPSPIEVCDAPKGDNLVRPAARLALVDRVVYTAAVGECLEVIRKATRWSQNSRDFAVRIDPARMDGRGWIRSPVKGWTEFRERSLQRLEAKSLPWSVSADIAGYFENITLDILLEDLRRIGAPDEVVQLLARCLAVWSVVPGRGLPQGVEASDLLAKLYLEPVDRHLSLRFRHVRYVDDFRLFARTRLEAQRGLVELTDHLRTRGLTLQSAKTKIRPSGALREEVQGVVPALKAVNKEFEADAVAAGLMAGDVSLPSPSLDDLVGSDPDKFRPEVIREAFNEYVVNDEEPRQTMMRYLLNRLRSLRDPFAVEHCSEPLHSNPEWTPQILWYFERAAPAGKLEGLLVKVLRGRQGAIFPYQRYLVLDWLCRNATSLNATTLGVVRQLAFRSEGPSYVRGQARRLLGQVGNNVDLENLQRLYNESDDAEERANLLCCLSRVEKSRRNRLLRAATREGGLAERAATCTRRIAQAAIADR